MIPFKQRLAQVFAGDSVVPLNLRAIWTGAVVDIAGSLVMSLVVGVAAVLGMVSRGDPSDTIVSEMQNSFALVLCVAASGLLMSLAGGYVAATLAGRSQVRHAVWTGVASVVLNLAMLAIIGDNAPAWLVAISTAAIVPAAALGGYLAMPIVVPAVSAERLPR